MATPSRRITFRLSEYDLARLAAAAARMKCELSDVVRAALLDFLNRSPPPSAADQGRRKNGRPSTRKDCVS